MRKCPLSPAAQSFTELGGLVLKETYGHVPMYICRFDGNRLVQTLPLMEVASRWTGRRGVSLPFTDACAALCEEGADGRSLYREAMDRGRQR